MFSLILRNISTSRWIGTQFGTDIHGPQTTYPNDFGDPNLSSGAIIKSNIQFVKLFGLGPNNK